MGRTCGGQWSEVGGTNVSRAARIGVDVGGTKVAAGLVNANGEILSQHRVTMVSNDSAERGLQAVLSAIAQVLPDGTSAIAGIGICAPGPLNPNTGVILNPPNVPCWRNFPLADTIRDVHRVPVKVDNDANAAALAETRWGAGRGHHPPGGDGSQAAPVAFGPTEEPDWPYLALLVVGLLTPLLDRLFLPRPLV